MPKRENLFINLGCSIVAPTFILAKLSGEEQLGPALALVIALAFPLIYGIADFARRRSFNFIVGIGLLSTSLTGGFALAKLDGLWFAVKEASVPAAIGLMVLASMRSSRPLVRELLYNDQVLDTPKIDAALSARGRSTEFEGLLRQSSLLATGAFLLSAALNFFLASWVLTAPTGSPEFNEQLARMQWLSWPVITLPTGLVMLFALWRLLSGIKRLAGLDLEAAMHPQPPKSPPPTSSS